EHLFSVAQIFNLPYLFSALRTRHVWSESAGLAVAAAFGVPQLVGAFARGTGESAASWLALAEESGDKSPHCKRWRDCETAASVPTPGLCYALNRYPPSAACRPTGADCKKAGL